MIEYDIAVRPEVRPGFRDGYRWERQFFGCTAGEFPVPRMEPLHPALNTVARLQRDREWDPCDPKTEIGRRLFESVKHNLNPEDRDDLKLYCAIGTALDHFHQADGFFRVRTHVVLLDLTVRRDKLQAASVIFRRCDRSVRHVEQVGAQIAQIFIRSIESVTTNGR